MRKQLLVLTALLLAACGGQTVSLTVDDATYRAPLVNGGVGVAYFSITSNVADQIVGVSSPDAASVEMHTSGESNGMASMQKVEAVELPAGERVTFGPGGLHLMVFGPHTQPANATFPIQITLESGRVETISFRSADGGR
jgi:copper(I)-binding protein